MVTATVTAAVAGCSSGRDGAAAPAPTGGAEPDAAAPGPEACVDHAADVSLRNARDLWPTLSSTCLFRRGAGPEGTDPKGLPYELRTPLFSDYTTKTRFVFLPAGATMEYRADSPLELPVGTVIAKTFSYGGGADGKPLRAIETRLLVHTASGWIGLPYVWNDEQTDATLRLAGEVRSLAWALADGTEVRSTYLVPNANQCGKCHEQDGKIAPIGPTGMNLDRPTPGHPDESQLARWAESGVLRGLPPAESRSRLAAWDDPSTGTVAERARAWLHANCAYCHSRGGTASNSALFLGLSETDPTALGICKTPVAAGKGSGGRLFAIVPGRPDESILVYRLEATGPDEAMPEIGRSVVSREGVALVREWISGLSGSCAAPNPTMSSP